MTADDETRRQLDELRDYDLAEQRIRDAHQRRLYVLQEQAAKLGRGAPPELVIEITDIAEQVRVQDERLREVRAKIAKLELAPQSALAVPPGPAVIPELIPAVVDTRLQALELGQARLESTVAGIGEQVELSREESREWRSAERSERRESQRTHRLIYAFIGAALLILAVAVVLVAIKA